MPQQRLGGPLLRAVRATLFRERGHWARLLMLTCSLAAPLLACSQAVHPPTELLACVNWVDPATGLITTDRALEIEDGLLRRVHAAGPECDATIWAMPSLWDSHTHLFVPGTNVDEALAGLIAHGVTGVRDLGGSAEMLAATRAALNESPELAFDIVAAVTIIDGDPPVDPLFVDAVGSRAELEAALDRLEANGADFVKVYTLFPAELFDALIERASARGLSVAGHLPRGVGLVRAVSSSMVSIEHLVEERGFLCDALAEDRCDAALDTLASGRTALTPTLVTTAWKAEARGDPTRLLRAEALVRLLHQRGILLLAGTDLGITPGAPGALLIDELERIVVAGLDPAAALRAATFAPRVAFGRMDPERPWIDTEADLVVTCANPFEALPTLRQPLHVMSDGVEVFSGLACGAREVGRTSDF